MTKPQITLFDGGGAHNAQIENSRARILKGGSWKRQRIIKLIPADAMIPAKVALSHEQLAYPPNNGVLRILAQGMEVGDAYSTALAQILEHPEFGNWEYLLTIEHDNCPPADGVLKLLDRLEAHPELACVSGLYWTKGEGGVPQIWGDPKDPLINFRPQPPDPNGGLVECCGTGMGFAIWRMKMFKDKQLRRPWFVTQKENGVATQDLYFWADARRYGYRCAVDCSVKVGHYDHATDTMWGIIMPFLAGGSLWFAGMMASLSGSGIA
jgi:hypothetical protein